MSIARRFLNFKTIAIVAALLFVVMVYLAARRVTAWDIEHDRAMTKGLVGVIG